MASFSVDTSSETIRGTAGADSFTGVAGNYVIWGKQTIVGGEGNDFYAISGMDITVKEDANGGADWVTSLTTYVLPDNVENLLTYGYAAVGNDLNNRIEGYHQIIGGKGNDTLVGGHGVHYDFGEQSGHDVITNWSTTSVLRLNYPIFTSFAAVQRAMVQEGSDVVIRLDASDSIRVQNTHLSDFAASNFHLGLDTSKLGALTFADEFNTLSTGAQHSGVGTWGTKYETGGYNAVDGRTLGGNHEQQLYVDPEFAGRSGKALGLNPFSIQDGVLTITEAPMPEAAKTSAYDFKYMSGMLTNKETFAQTYGYFEAKMQMPAGAGVWPAFWLMRQDSAWPPELDVLESWGSDARGGTTAVGTLHTAETGEHTTQDGYTYLPDGTTAMHTYGILWTPETLTWYVDGVEINSVPTPADMHDPMYMIVNLALSPGDIDPNLTSELKVDYIHAYSLTDVPTIATGRAALWAGTDYTGSMPTAPDGFNAAFYAGHNLDVVAAGVDLLTHYQQAGKTEGRAGFDPNGDKAGTADAYYNTIVAATGNVSLAATVSHDSYQFGPGFGIDTIAGFDVANDRINVSALTATYGQPRVSALADGSGVMIRWSGGETLQLLGLTVADASAALSATAFAALPTAQAAWGRVEGVTDGFNTAYYAAHNPDVVAANMDLLKHYIFFGKAEGRLPYDSSAPTIVLADLNGSTGGSSPAAPTVFPIVGSGDMIPIAPATLTATPTPPPTPTDTSVTPVAPITPTQPAVAPTTGMDATTGHAAWTAVTGIADGFNAAFYASHNLDVVASGMDLLTHYQMYGKAEGRAAYDPNGTAADTAEASYLVLGTPSGSATLTATAGRDHFYLPAGFVTETIKGFDTAHDTLDVSALLAKYGNPTFVDIANGAGTELRWTGGETVQLLGVSNSDAHRIVPGETAAVTPAAPTPPTQSAWGAVKGVADGFNAAFYAAHNPDVVASGMNLLTHYQMYGKAEGRAAYDASGTAAEPVVPPTTGGGTTTGHAPWGAVAGVTDGFNAAFYAEHNPDVVASGMDLFDHYQRFGKAEGRTAYDTSGTADTAVTSTTGHAPWGAVAGVTDGFNAGFYAAHNLDVVASGMDLLTHYQTYGKYEGRTAYDTNGAAADTAAASYLMVAGPGNDTMIASVAKDIFYLAPGTGADIIGGFDVAHDVLDVSALLAKYGNPTFADLANGAGTELHWTGGESVQLLGVSNTDAHHAVLG